MPNHDVKEEMTLAADQQTIETHYASKVDFLMKRLHYHIEEYKEKRNQSRKHANGYKFSAVLLGALITILLAVKTSVILGKPADEILSMVALVLSTVVTAMASWEAFADYRGKWIRARSILVTLYNIRDDLRYALAGNAQPSDTAIDSFYERLRLALNETNEEWMSNRGKAIAGVAPPSDKS